MKKKVLGYGYKQGCESLDEALDIYGYQGLYNTYKDAAENIEKRKLEKSLSRSAKPKIFRVVVEIEEQYRDSHTWEATE